MPTFDPSKLQEPSTSSQTPSFDPARLQPTADEASQSRQKRLQDAAVAAWHAQGGGGSADLFANNFLASLAKPIGSAVDALGGMTSAYLGTGDPEKDATFGERYAANTSAFDQELAETRKRAGGAGTAAEIAGSVLSPLNYIAPETRFVGPMIAGATQGAAASSNDPTSALKGGVTGAAINAAVPGAVSLAKPVGKGLSWLGEGMAGSIGDWVNGLSIAPVITDLLHGGGDLTNSLIIPAATVAGMKGGGYALQKGGEALTKVPVEHPIVNAIARRAGLYGGSLVK